jgi:hypothetical protein
MEVDGGDQVNDGISNKKKKVREFSSSLKSNTNFILTFGGAVNSLLARFCFQLEHYEVAFRLFTHQVDKYRKLIVYSFADWRDTKYEHFIFSINPAVRLRCHSDCPSIQVQIPGGTPYPTWRG